MNNKKSRKPAHSECEKCKKMTRRRYNKNLCWSCYNKNKHKIGIYGIPTEEKIEKTFNASPSLYYCRGL